MGDQNTFLLKDILTGIADSLSEAQQQLKSLPPFDEFGRPNSIYHLPYLEFNIQVNSEFETKTTENTGRRTNALKFSASAKNSSADTNNQLSSAISGKFVAAIPNEGLPQLFLNVSSEKITNDKYKINVKIINSLGENIPNANVEFNFDRINSKLLNNNVNVEAPKFLKAQESMTNNDGETNTDIEIKTNQTFVFIVNSGTTSKIISIKKS